MARLVDCCPSSDNELPDLDTLLRRPNTRATKQVSAAVKPEAKTLASKSTSKPATKSGTRRVRRLGDSSQVSTNPLFQKWNSKESKNPRGATDEKPHGPKHGVRQASQEVQQKNPPNESDSENDEPSLRTRRPRRGNQPIFADSEDDLDSATDTNNEPLLTRVRTLQTSKSRTAHEPVGKMESQPAIAGSSKPPSESTIIEQMEDNSYPETVHGDNGAEDLSIYITAEEESSEFNDESSFSAESDDSPAQPRYTFGSKLDQARDRKLRGTRKTTLAEGIPLLVPKSIEQHTISVCNQTTSTKGDSKPKKLLADLKGNEGFGHSTITPTAADLLGPLSKLRLQLEDFSDEEAKEPSQNGFTTPPSTPPRASTIKGLKSPSKRIVIPQTPHHHNTDDFWNQDTVNDWNDHHSPRKLVLPPVNRSLAKSSPKKAAKKEPKKTFDARKQTLAEAFLAELDREITQGKIAELAEATGGVKLVWTKTLNTTAGRASWRRETIRTRKADGTQLLVQYKHHASIELAEKVIDEEHRLLNVVAHEFCHLANFMISGITNNPHGKEFKSWAAKCSRVFGDRGIEVTTKHSYDIDFKYVWECEECGSEFKRHSKSIDPQRHRCGSCKGLLKQTKPVPRGVGAGGKPSRYQTFVKQQMAVVRAENPGSPQKNLMKLVAEKWAKQEGSNKTGKGSKSRVDDVLGKMVDLTLEEDT